MNYQLALSDAQSDLIPIPKHTDISSNISKQLTLSNRRYLGCKQSLLTFIDETLTAAGIEYSTFCDAFAGTGVVGEYFLSKGKQLITNDILRSNYIILDAFLGGEIIRKDLLDKKIIHWNTLAGRTGKFTKAYGGLYFHHNVTKKLDVIRNTIDLFKGNSREKNYLIAALLLGLDKVANTCGHYDAFRSSEPSTDVQFFPLNVKTGGKTSIYNKDVAQLLPDIKTDVLYLDPPYNSRQYSTCYHVLEAIAANTVGTIGGVGRKPEVDDKKSKWCTSKALVEFTHIVKQANAKYIVVSYNNMFKKGNSRSAVKLSYTEIVDTLKSIGSVQVFETPHKVFNTGKTEVKDHKELLFVCNVAP